MSCDVCTDRCVRRDIVISPTLKRLCKTRSDYAEVLDKRHGVKRPEVVPDSLQISEESPRPRRRYRPAQRVNFTKLNPPSKGRGVKYACGITTVPERRFTTLPQTLTSLSRAGFGGLRLFIDGCPDPNLGYEEFGLNLTYRCPKVRTAGNWVLSLYELYIREPKAERYVLFQDDCIVVVNLKEYLARSKIPDGDYWNLFRFPTSAGKYSQAAPPTDNFRGFYPSNQKGLSAIALVFPKSTLMNLLGHDHLVKRVQNAHRGHQSIDGGVLETIRKQGGSELVHHPSLAQHIGDKSSMGHSQFPKSDTFPGEGFDALSLIAPLPPTTPSRAGLGDKVSSALSKVGITEEKVSAWLGRPCGCSERREKLNALGAWASRIVSGRTDDAEKHLNELMGVTDEKLAEKGSDPR